MADTGLSWTAALRSEEPGLWVAADRRTPVFPAGKPALFLDRDGTINVDTGYPSDPADIVLRDEIVPVIRSRQRRRPSGGRWSPTSRASLAAISAGRISPPSTPGCSSLSRSEDCRSIWFSPAPTTKRDRPPLGVADHPMRKPNPGMLLRAAELLGSISAVRSSSATRPSDMEAGRRAGIVAGWLVGRRRSGRNDAQFVCEPLS